VELLRGKSNEEIIVFFRRAGEAYKKGSDEKGQPCAPAARQFGIDGLCRMA